MSWQGTIGKKLLKIKVEADDDMRDIKFQRVVSRNLFKVVSIGLLFSGFVLIMFDQKKRGLHDRMAGTVVIFVEN